MISYGPLRSKLAEHKITFSDLREKLGIGTNTNVKMNNDSGYVSLEVLDKICNYLSQELQRPVAIEEIIKFIPDPIPVPGEQESENK